MTNCIGNAMAGHPFRVSNHKKVKEYDNQLTNLVNRVIELSREQYNAAIIDLAHRYLNIVQCKCGYPKVSGFVCNKCGK